MLGVLRNQHGTWVLEKENDLLLGHNNEVPNGFQISLQRYVQTCI